jgi:hypothetical protein
MIQALNYLRASNLPACLLINFGTRRCKFGGFTHHQLGKPLPGNTQNDDLFI